jgi:hypothetical protein
MGEVRPPVALLRSVVRERVGEEMIRHRWRPPWKLQRVETPPDVMEDLEDERIIRSHDFRRAASISVEFR